MSLGDTKIGNIYRVTGMQVAENVMRRLEALGILEGTRVEVLNMKRNGATIIKVRGARWALGNDIVRGIEVEEYAS